MTTQESKHAPVERIKDVELLPLLQERKVEIFVDVVKSKKKDSTDDLYSQELRWVDTREPVLTKDGSIDCTATIMWGVQPPEKRNTGQYAKPDSAYDECDISFGTKYSGTFGSLMCHINDFSFREGIMAFTQRPDQKDIYNGHDIDPHEFCKKNAGSLKKPPLPAEQAAYRAAADWSFPIKLKIEKRTKTGEISDKPFMFKVDKYVRDAKTGKPVLQEIKINSKTIHKELTKDSIVMLRMRLGNCSMRATNHKGQIVNTFFPAFNVGHITVLKKGERGGVMKADRPTDEIEAALAAAGVSLSITGQAEEDAGDDSPDENLEAAAQTPLPPVFKPTGAPATGADLASQFAALGTQ